jgi:biopolymer transport protein ExbD
MAGLKSQVELPITPFLDFSFQVLFFFIMQYNPDPMEGQLDMSLPAQKEYVQKPQLPQKPHEPPGPDEKLDEPPEVTIVIKTHQDRRNTGNISQISVLTNSGETPIPTPEGKLDKLVDYLKKIRENLGNKNDVKMLPDSLLKWEAVVKVRDACQKAGFINASFAPPPDLVSGG